MAMRKRSARGNHTQLATVTQYSPALAAPEAGPIPENFGRDIDPRRIWKTITRRRKLMTLVFFAFVGAVLIFTLLQPRQFATQVKLISGGSSGDATNAATANAGTSLPVLNALLAAGNGSSPETYAELLQQSPVAEEVIKRMGLHTSVGALLSHVSVRPVTNTSILALRVAWSDPETSARIANAFAAVFVDRERMLVARQADTAIGFLQEQLPDAQRHMQAAQNTLAAYQVRAGIADLPTQTQADISTLASFESKQHQAELEARQAEAQLSVLQGALASTPAFIVGSQNLAANPVLAQLQNQVASLHVQLDAARQQYTDEHPTVVGLKAQLQQAEAELRAQPAQVSSGSSSVPNPNYQQLQGQIATLASTATGAMTQAAMLAKQREAFRPKLDRLPEQARRIGDLQREAKATESFYEALQHKYQEAMISKTTALSDVSITQAADPSVYNMTPNFFLNLALGIFIGLGLALSSAFLADFLDDRFRTEDDVKERLGLPVLASVPAIESGDWRANQWIKPLSVEAFYQLVASLRYSSSAPPRSIAFVSPDQGDGKSTVAVNTAISMGLMRARVLIIDADLRRPSIHQKLNLGNERGLSDVLVGLARFPEAMKPSRHTGVWVLTAGRPAPNPVGLLQSVAFDRLLKKARERFDFIIIDGPALRSIVDGVVLAHKAEGTVMVVSSPRSDGRSVQGALEKLRSLGSMNLLGVVLNGVKPDVTENTNEYSVGVGQSISLPGTSRVG
jgi:capsular exopolysaccharide synthesis family protein